MASVLNSDLIFMYCSRAVAQTAGNHIYYRMKDNLQLPTYTGENAGIFALPSIKFWDHLDDSLC